MDQTMTAPTQAQTSRRRPRPTSAQTPKQKKARKNGMIASTILLDPRIDERLDILAFARGEDRSRLAARFILQALNRHDVEGDLMRAAERFKMLASAKSDEDTDRQSGVGENSGEDAEG
jgi:predicted transcriptional regulator